MSFQLVRGYVYAYEKVSQEKKPPHWQKNALFLLTVSGLGHCNQIGLKLQNPIFNFDGSCFIFTLEKDLSVFLIRLSELSIHDQSMEWATINSRNRGRANRAFELSPARAGMLRKLVELSSLTCKTVSSF
jgi:hypothetical protein